MPEKYKTKVRIGIMCGSFNPLHMGHIMIANYMCAYENMDEVWLVVTPENPSAEEKIRGMLEASARLDIVDRFCKQYPHIYPCDIEFQLNQPNYTIETIRALKKQYPEKEFSLLIGEDNWVYFNQWHQHEQIRKEVVNILIYPRKNIEEYTEGYPDNVWKVKAPLIEISSTFIRNAIKREKDIRSFLPMGEYEYLIENDMYKSV